MNHRMVSCVYSIGTMGAGHIICTKQKARITEWLHEPNILF